MVKVKQALNLSCNNSLHHELQRNNLYNLRTVHKTSCYYTLQMTSTKLATIF
jgi:hypothetical protein